MSSEKDFRVWECDSGVVASFVRLFRSSFAMDIYSPLCPAISIPLLLRRVQGNGVEVQIRPYGILGFYDFCCMFYDLSVILTSFYVWLLLRKKRKEWEATKTTFCEGGMKGVMEACWRRGKARDADWLFGEPGIFYLVTIFRVWWCFDWKSLFEFASLLSSSLLLYAALNACFWICLNMLASVSSLLPNDESRILKDSWVWKLVCFDVCCFWTNFGFMLPPEYFLSSSLIAS